VGRLGLFLAVLVGGALLLRGVFILMGVPYLVWMGLRWGGYPLWAQCVAVAIVIGTFAYGIYRAIDESRRT
jgi:hypothetical protein